jgi:hypothetical protein
VQKEVQRDLGMRQAAEVAVIGQAAIDGRELSRHMADPPRIHGQFWDRRALGTGVHRGLLSCFFESTNRIERRKLEHCHRVFFLKFCREKKPS